MYMSSYYNNITLLENRKTSINNFEEIKFTEKKNNLLYFI